MNKKEIEKDPPTYALKIEKYPLKYAVYEQFLFCYISPSDYFFIPSHQQYQWFLEESSTVFLSKLSFYILNFSSVLFSYHCFIYIFIFLRQVLHYTYSFPLSLSCFLSCDTSYEDSTCLLNCQFLLWLFCRSRLRFPFHQPILRIFVYKRFLLGKISKISRKLFYVSVVHSSWQKTLRMAPFMNCWFNMLFAANTGSAVRPLRMRSAYHHMFNAHLTSTSFLNHDTCELHHTGNMHLKAGAFWDALPDAFVAHESWPIRFNWQVGRWSCETRECLIRPVNVARSELIHCNDL